MTDYKEPMFSARAGGFTLTLPNLWTISVQFHDSELTGGIAPTREGYYLSSPLAEVALWHTDKLRANVNALLNPDYPHSCYAKITIGDLVKFIAQVADLPPPISVCENGERIPMRQLCFIHTRDRVRQHLLLFPDADLFYEFLAVTR